MKLIREQIPPGTWIVVVNYRQSEFNGKAYQISERTPHLGNDQHYLNILGAPQPNPDGGYNIAMEDCRLAEPHEIPGQKIINSYPIY